MREQKPCGKLSATVILRGQLDVVSKGDPSMFRNRPVRHAVLTLLALTCAACAAPASDSNNSEAREEPVYRTGSHIPVKDPASSSAKSVDVQSIQDAQRNSNSAPRLPTTK